MPGGAAFRARWRVTGTGVTGIAETHRHDRYAVFVVERGLVQLQPVAQAAAAGIVPRDAGGMHARSRRLADDQQARLGTGGEHRPRSKWQLRLADAAGADVAQQVVKLGAHGGSSFPGLRMPSGSNTV